MKKVIRNNKIGIFLLTVLLLNSCVEEGNPFIYQEDAHGRGKTTFFIDESFKPLFETSINTFEGAFPKAEIIPNYVTETEAIEAFKTGKTNTICITREFSEAEKVKMRKSLIEYRSDLYAKDGIALIMNPENPDSKITISELKDILSGKKEKWTTDQTTINMVFDSPNSANFIYLKSLIGDQSISKNVFAVKSNKDVIEYVKTHQNAIGVIGVNWISDKDDEEVLNFLDGIKVMEVAINENEEYYQPYQAYIYTDEYPLTRNVYLINKGKRSGLNTGFVLYLLGEKGQLIVQKSSLVPANSPVRLIKITSD
jgi:phosphate transport system substrate-binding protein